MNENKDILPLKLGSRRKGRPFKHGGFSILNRAEVPYARKKIMRYFHQVRDSIIQDLGGSARLTTAQLLLVDRIIFKLGFLRCVEIYIAEKGPFTEAGQLEPILRETYLAYANSLRLDLQALGIKEKAEEIITLTDYIKEIEKNDKAIESDQSETVDSGASQGQKRGK